jgi:YVTN family beta-propeller protein
VTLATTPVGHNPYTVVLPADGKTAYVSNWGGHSVSVRDALTGATKAEITVGTHPSAMALDTASGRLYVANTDSDNVSVIDTATNAVLQGEPHLRPGLRLAREGQRRRVPEPVRGGVGAEPARAGAQVRHARQLLRSLGGLRRRLELVDPGVRQHVQPENWPADYAAGDRNRGYDFQGGNTANNAAENTADSWS